ncbi:MAG: radical SAM protein [Gemmatimonadota bacterium]|nr:radical SAM protein [Gemmatimonadota bacterium]
MLLINPPVYDAQYWARWSQPAGLLRIATYLRGRGYEVDLIDCMETDAKGFVRKRRRMVDGKPLVYDRGDISKVIWHFGLSWNEVVERMKALPTPDEVWIGSVMTYWWESTRDAVQCARQVFPKTRICVGGIYPTLAPDHAIRNLIGADVVFTGEIKEASDCWTDLSRYKTPPTYAILTSSRGCPWDCNYCAARTLNGGSNKVRGREPEDVVAEIEDKITEFGVRHFGFYEDNALVLRGHLRRIMELIIERGLNVTLYAPEGFETRMLDEDTLRVMKQAGFRKIHLPFETLKWETNEGWNRRHASTASFEQALEAAIRAGFKPRTEEINAFVLFGLPDDNLQDIVDGVTYVHHMVGSVIPMLFTPVPGTNVYRQHSDYLHQEMGWDLERLNGKLLPFLEYNQRRYPELRASDYLELEGLMSILNNGKFLSRAVDLCDASAASRAFREAARSAGTGVRDPVASIP